MRRRMDAGDFLGLALGFCSLFSMGALGAQQAQAPSQAPVPGQDGQSQPGETGTKGTDPAATNASQGLQSFTVQTATSSDEEPTFVLHSTTRRLVVDVVVTGPDGKAATGLTEKDFKVQEDRKEQPIRGFEEHTPEGDKSPLPPGPAQLPSHTFINLEPAPASGPPVAIVLDFLNTPLNDQMYAHEQIVKFLENKPASMDVAIFALADKLSLVQGFTTDTQKLLAAMKTKAANPRLVSASEQLLRAETTLDSFLDIGTFLAGVSGRKNLLWFSGSFDMMTLPKSQEADHGLIVVGTEAGTPNPGPGAVVTASNLLPGASAGSEASGSGYSTQISDMTVLTEKLRKVAIALAVSQTSVYPIDARGLMVDSQYSSGNASASNMNANPLGIQGTPGMPKTAGGAPANVQAHNDFRDSINGTQATMEEIAEATGGKAFVNTNGIAMAASQAVTAGSSYYTLVYAPTNENFDGGLRTIHVSLDKPGYKLAYRSAYYAVDAATVVPDVPDANSLSAAMLRGAPEAHGLVFKAQIDPEGPPALATVESPLAVRQPVKVTRKMKKDPDFLSGMVQSYNIRLAILAQQLAFKASPDGRRNASLELAVYAYAADGRRIGGTKQNLQASMPPVVYAHALKDGMYHHLKVELPVETASLRLAIHDTESHSTGSLEIAMPLPPAQDALVQAPVGTPAKKAVE